MYLEHYGIKRRSGRYRWGSGKNPYQSDPARKAILNSTLKDAKTANMSKWGTDKNHNVLYVTGRSGSGKSTVTLALKDKNTDVLHLDSYFEDGPQFNDVRNKNFNSFLKQNNVSPPYEFFKNVPHEERAPYYDKFEKAIEDFGAQQHANKRKVIAEGVQIYDYGIGASHDYFRDKPIVIIQTNSLISMYRRAIRDGESTAQAVKNLVQYSIKINSELSDLEKVTNARVGEEWVKQHLQ